MTGVQTCALPIWAYGKPGVIAGSEPLSGVSTSPADISAQLAKQAPTPAVAKSPILEKDRPSYFGLASELGMAGMPMGMGLTAALQEGQAARDYDEEQKRKKAAEKADIASLVNRLYGRAYASGGFTVSNPTNPPTTIKFPEWFVEEFAQSGGLQSLAHGGYINTQPFDPNTAYPQSEIHRAAPYAASSPIRNEVLDFADGGLLEGDGDGMSDDIPANIDGKEKVRVADGEFVVPSDLAEQFGAGKLESMLNAVRKAAHAKKGKQIQQDAGKRAFIRTLSGVKA